jgi:diguanylate cyclase (GGDEF)-like protein
MLGIVPDSVARELSGPAFAGAPSTPAAWRSLPRPKIATKLYGVIALTLAVVGTLAAATILFASRSEDVARQVRQEGIGGLQALANLELALERQRRLVATAALGPEPRRQQDERAFEELATKVPPLMQRLGLDASHELRRQYANLALQGALIFAFVADQRLDQAEAMTTEYAASMESLQRRVQAERALNARAGEAMLKGIAASGRSLASWVTAAAAICGLALGPVGLLFLRRMLSRLQGIRTALLRLARNDTSIDIPGLAYDDELGQLARSVAVFKAKSLELLQKKGELERLNLQLDAAINNMPVGLSMFDAQERLLVCNRRYSEMYDLPSELSQPGAAHCAHWEHRERKGARHHVPNDAGEARHEDEHCSMVIEFGNERIIAVARQPLQGGGWVALHEDITQRRQQEQEITHLARHDPLTNLANRALFREQLQQSLLRLGRGQGFAVLCLDLDRFKIVNDTLGHPVGDVLLTLVSARLLACVRKEDVVARLGGDEFAIIQANVRDPNATESLAARIVEAVSTPYEIGGQRIDISTSIGMTMAPRDGADADQLMKNADIALYRVKAEGRHGFSFFKPEMNHHIQARRTLETDLRRAFEKEQLALSYQPIVCLKSQKVTGFEALMRWTLAGRWRRRSSSASPRRSG